MGTELRSDAGKFRAIEVLIRERAKEDKQLVFYVRLYGHSPLDDEQFIFSEKYLIYSSRYKEQHQMK